MHLLVTLRGPLAEVRDWDSQAAEESVVTRRSPLRACSSTGSASHGPDHPELHYASVVFALILEEAESLLPCDC